jgi:nickel-dependent lactate racemase
MSIIKLPQLAWFNSRDLELSFPDDWQIKMFYMVGYNRPELPPEAIVKALKNPIGTKTLKELAGGKKEVAIVFDDLTRVTRASKIVPYVLSELSEAGINDNNIRFICGLGAHGVMDRSDFAKKLGEEIVSRFKVFNHNPFGNCVYAGTTKTFKTKVYINEEYMKCDLKIVIGSCVPHSSAGFGGGGKLILPGIASMETIIANHGSGGAITDPIESNKKPAQGMGLIENNRLRKDIDEGAELAGIDFLINTLVNLWGESVAIYAGECKQVHAAAVREAKTHYRTSKIDNMDIVISNNYAKSSESAIGLSVAVPMVSSQGGDIVVITNAPEGQVNHYLAGLFGKNTYAIQHKEFKVPSYINRVIIYNEYPYPGSNCYEENPKISYSNHWDEIIRSLRKDHGPGTRVAVIPDATNQYFPRDD